MDKIVAFTNKTDGRDKICKFLQYASRFLKALIADKALQERLNGLFTASRDARKIFRLGKFINEIHAISAVLNNLSIDLPEMVLQLLIRSSYFVYWVLDNLGTLCTIKLIKLDPAKFSKNSNKAWFTAIVFSLISLARNLSLNFAKEARIKHTADPNLQTTKQSLDVIRKTRTGIYQNIGKNAFDLLPASQFANVPATLFKKNLPEEWIGLGGTVSSVISCYQIWTQ
jgi:peroxin-11B